MTKIPPAILTTTALLVGSSRTPSPAAAPRAQSEWSSVPLKALANKDTQFSAFTNEAQCHRPLASSPAFGHQLRLILRSAVRDFNVVQKPLGHITDLI